MKGRSGRSDLCLLLQTQNYLWNPLSSCAWWKHLATWKTNVRPSRERGVPRAPRRSWCRVRPADGTSPAVPTGKPTAEPGAAPAGVSTLSTRPSGCSEVRRAVWTGFFCFLGWASLGLSGTWSGSIPVPARIQVFPKAEPCCWVGLISVAETTRMGGR